jgi:hypothetical protein
MDSNEITHDKNQQDELIQLEMIEGYREMAEFNLRLAEESFPLVCEMLSKYTEWYEEGDS